VIALAARVGVALRLEAAVAAGLSGLAVGIWSGAPLIGLAVGVGGFLLIGQIIATRREAAEGLDREHVRRVIEEAAPLTRTGTPLETALIRAARLVGGAGGQALAEVLSHSAAGRAVPEGALSAYPYSQLVFQLWRIHREQGGDPSAFLNAYRTSLGMSEDLARKKQLALTQIRWQANVITVFFFLVLAFSFFHASVFISALLENPETRWMTALSACLVIWGRVVLNGLARTMS